MDRRSVLAAAMVAPVAISAPVSAFAASSEFERALASYRHERKAFEVALSDEEANAASARVDAAFLQLLRAPARHGGDIATKIDALMVEYEDSIMDEDRLAIIAQDARRFAN